MRKLRAYIVIFLFVFSCLVYLIYRENIILYEWIEKPILNNLQSINLPNWVLYNLPDAVWVMTLLYCLIYIWDFKLKRANSLWIILPIFIAFSIEFGQKYNWLNGTYDKIDLVFILIGSSIPLFDLIKTHYHEKTIH